MEVGDDEKRASASTLDEASGSVWSESPAAPRGEVRDPRLDGLRGLAILLVLVFHATLFGTASGPWQRAALELPALGWSGVDLFFVLSGFLITGILLRTRDGPSYYTSFYARRVLRIFPLYYAFLWFCIVIAPRIQVVMDGRAHWLLAPVAEPFWYWAFLSNVGVAVRGSADHFLEVTWSLAVEEHFYLIWPWIVRHASERRLLAICLGTVVGALVLRVVLLASGAPNEAVYMLTPCRLDALATGALIAVVASRPDGLRRLAPSAPILAAGSAILLAISLAVLAGWPAPGTPEGPLERGRHPWILSVGLTLLCATYGSLLVWLVTAPAGARVAWLFQRRVLQGLGRYSYALYLVHMPIALSVQQRLGAAVYRDHFVWAQLGGFALTMALSYSLARLSWLLLEGPMLRLKRYFPYRRDGSRAG